MATIVQCPGCGNMERLRNVYCRICGERLANPGRERFMRILPWAIMLGGIALVTALNIGSRDTAGAMRILFGSFLLVIGSHRTVAWAGKALHYREPLYRRVSIRKRGELQRVLVPRGALEEGGAGTGGDEPSKRAEDAGEKAYKSRMLVGIYDRNIGLLLGNLGDEARDDGYLVGKTRKAANYYARNKELLMGILGPEEYGRRLALFSHIVDLLIREGRNARQRGLDRAFKETIRSMVGEVDRLEACVEVEEALAESGRSP